MTHVSVLVRDRLTDATVDAIRAAYVAGEYTNSIRARFKISGSSLHYWLDGGPPKGPRHRPPIPRRKARHGPRAARAAKRNRAALLERLWSAATRQVEQIERRLADDGTEPIERERNSRLLAVTARTLRELATLDRAQKKQDTEEAAPGQDEPHDDQQLPRDIDELRRELARRVEGILRKRHADGTAGDV